MKALKHLLVVVALIYGAAISLAAEPMQATSERSGGAFGYPDPGTTNYPEAGVGRMDSLQFYSEFRMRTAVVDESLQHAYYGTFTQPAAVIRVALGDKQTPPARLDAIWLNPGEDNIINSLVDQEAGYGYFGTATKPGRIIKVKLGRNGEPHRRVGSLLLPPGENLFDQPPVLIAGGYALFGTDSESDIILKVKLGEGDLLPEVVSRFHHTERGFRGAVAVDGGTTVYYGTASSPSQIIMLDAGAGDSTPTVLGSISLESAEGIVKLGFADSTTNYIYFLTSTGRFVKVATGQGVLPRRLGSIRTRLSLYDVIFDDTTGFAYQATIGHISKIHVGIGEQLPWLVSELQPSSGMNFAQAGYLNPSKGLAWFATDIDHQSVTAFDLGEGDDPPSSVWNHKLPTGEGSPSTIEFDRATGRVIVSNSAFPSSVYLLETAEDGRLTRMGRTTLEATEWIRNSIGSANGYAYYLGTSSVIKVAFAGEERAPRRVGALQLEDEFNLYGAVDEQSGFGYLGHAHGLIKFRLGQDDADPENLHNVRDEAMFGGGCMALAPSRRVGFMGTGFGRILRFSLSQVDSIPPSIESILQLDGVAGAATAFAVDEEGGFLYAITSNRSVAKIAIGDSETSMTLIGTSTPSPDPYAFHRILHLPASDELLVTAQGDHLYRFSAGSEGESPRQTSIGRTYGPFGYSFHPTAIRYDLRRDRIYRIGSGYLPFFIFGFVEQFAPSHKGLLLGTKVVANQYGVIDSIKFPVHSSQGEVRLALYNDREPKRLLWQSDAIGELPEDGLITVPISQGSPKELALQPGNYWAVWQTDTDARIGGHFAVIGHEGFKAANEFGPAPAFLYNHQVIPDSSGWSMLLPYETAPSMWIAY